MKPYHEIFPEHGGATVTLELAETSGTLPGGSYAYIECYCTAPGCDCRRVTLAVADRKARQQASICLGFDGDGPFSGPYLDPSCYQAPYAAELLDFCVHTLNARPDWVAAMYARYAQVRELVDRRPYQGKEFPQPGDLYYRAMSPPDLESVLRESVRHGCVPCCPQPPGEDIAATSKLMRLVELFARAGASAPVSIVLSLQEELHRLLLADPLAVEELPLLLAALSRVPRPDQDRVSAALRILCLTLDFYRVEAEGGINGARQQMQRLQSALALRIYREPSGEELRFSVTDILQQGHLKLIPELQAICDGAEAGRGLELPAGPGEEFIPGVLRHFVSAGVTSPFEGAQEIFDLFAVNDRELQAGLTWELLTADAPFLRDVAALLIFNADPEQSREVARMLVSVAGATLTPTTLRRLIMTRNWFPEPSRSIVDQTIANARRARVQCAHLERPVEESVYASCLDGAGRQTFHLLVPDGAAHAGCTIYLQQGSGVTGCSLVRLETRRDRDDFLRAARAERCCLEVSGDYLDLRLGLTIAEGNEKGRVPGHWLVRVAELLGRDHWKGVPFAAEEALTHLAEEIALEDAALLAPEEQLRSLTESGDWHGYRALFGSWREEGIAVARAVESVRREKGRVGAAAVAESICDQILEQTRPVLLDRLVLETLWLKFALEAPIPWQRMYHVAQAVADTSIALKEIPFAVSMARQSFLAQQKRSKGEKQGSE